ETGIPNGSFLARSTVHSRDGRPGNGESGGSSAVRDGRAFTGHGEFISTAGRVNAAQSNNDWPPGSAKHGRDVFAWRWPTAGESPEPASIRDHLIQFETGSFTECGN